MFVPVKLRWSQSAPNLFSDWNEEGGRELELEASVLEEIGSGQNRFQSQSVKKKGDELPCRITSHATSHKTLRQTSHKTSRRTSHKTSHQTSAYLTRQATLHKGLTLQNLL